MNKLAVASVVLFSMTGSSVFGMAMLAKLWPSATIPDYRELAPDVVRAAIAKGESPRELLMLIPWSRIPEDKKVDSLKIVIEKLGGTEKCYNTLSALISHAMVDVNYELVRALFKSSGLKPSQEQMRLAQALKIHYHNSEWEPAARIICQDLAEIRKLKEQEEALAAERAALRRKEVALQEAKQGISS